MAPARRRMSGEERKQDILRVAAAVFSQKGYRPTTVDALVEAAGISKGLFYIYFDSKKQAFMELVESYFTGFAEVLELNHTTLEGAFSKGVNAVEIFGIWRDNIARVFEYHVKNPDLTHVVYQEALGSDEDFSGRVNELSERASAMITEEFRMMAGRGALRPTDIEFVTAVAIGSMVYIIMDFVLRKKVSDVERLADMFLEYHARALSPAAVDVDRVFGKLPRQKRRQSA